MKEFELVFYRKPNGDCPVSDFLASLNKVMRFKMMHQLDLLELYGNRPKGDYSKFVEDGIFEVRAQTKTDITRIMFFFDTNRQIVLTNGFVKKTQRLPASELETAKRYRADYLARAKEGPAEQKPAAHSTTGPQWRPRLDDILADVENNKSKPQKEPQKGKQSYRR